MNVGWPPKKSFPRTKKTTFLGIEVSFPTWSSLSFDFIGFLGSTTLQGRGWCFACHSHLQSAGLSDENSPPVVHFFVNFSSGKQEKQHTHTQHFLNYQTCNIGNKKRFHKTSNSHVIFTSKKAGWSLKAPCGTHHGLQPTLLHHVGNTFKNLRHIFRFRLAS